MGISRTQALDCFRSDDLVGIGMEANAVRRRLHPENVVGYAMRGTIHCFGRAPSVSVAEVLDHGATCVRLTGCEDLSQIEDLLQGVRRVAPALWIECLSTSGIAKLAGMKRQSLRVTIAGLMSAGLNSFADEGVSPADPAALAEWCEVHRAAHGLGMQTTAVAIFGAGEPAEQRIDLLAAIHRLQQETGGFAAFAPRATEAPNGRELDGVTAVERLKTLAIARMFLDNIEDIQGGWSAQGLKVLQIGLRFGANDAGPIPLGGGVEEDVRRIIRDAGFRPAQRLMGYHAMQTI